MSGFTPVSHPDPLTDLKHLVRGRGGAESTMGDHFFKIAHPQTPKGVGLAKYDGLPLPSQSDQP